LEKLQEKDGLGNTFMNGSILLKWFLKQYDHGRGNVHKDRTRKWIFCCGNFLEFV